ncbi:MAG: 23S rRNA (guanosine(2251)-2'-O)-methyltransferase RlmB [Burkholderiales bacterium]|jgi:23S rRNA (guanosine2251-2'-O)-methyltransferase|nr:23S rRNA (guanosine(2251)-2'-O)-methyltransferase RlmB [Burkholderiales bacterium]
MGLMNHSSNDKLLFGFHAVMARLRQQPETIKIIYFDAARRDARLQGVLASARLVDCMTQAVDGKRLDQLTNHARHQGIVAFARAVVLQVRLDDILDTVAEPLLLILDGVTDPHNLGACLRSADAFGVDALIVPKDRSVNVNATVAKVACGAADTVPVITVTNLARTLEHLKERSVWCVAADSDGECLYDAELGSALAWVLGAEGNGLRRLTRERCDRVISIPMQGMVESLNVSVAAGICLAATQASRHHLHVERKQ